MSNAPLTGELPGFPESDAAQKPSPGSPGTARPRVRPVDRTQLTWQMLDVERLLEPDHPARAIWGLTGRLDLSGFHTSIEAVEGSAGRTPWDPRLLVSLWIYAYSRGISSAREIARRCGYEPAFQWLCGLGEINHHTLSDVRVNQEASLRELFVQVLGVLSAEGLITLERVMQDAKLIISQLRCDDRWAWVVSLRCPDRSGRVERSARPCAQDEPPIRIQAGVPAPWFAVE